MTDPSPLQQQRRVRMWVSLALQILGAISAVVVAILGLVRILKGQA